MWRSHSYAKSTWKMSSKLNKRFYSNSTLHPRSKVHSRRKTCCTWRASFARMTSLVLKGRTDSWQPSIEIKIMINGSNSITPKWSSYLSNSAESSVESSKRKLLSLLVRKETTWLAGASRLDCFGISRMSTPKIGRLTLGRSSGTSSWLPVLC